jgi:hypothetical protein
MRLRSDRLVPSGDWCGEQIVARRRIQPPNFLFNGGRTVAKKKAAKKAPKKAAKKKGKKK